MSKDKKMTLASPVTFNARTIVSDYQNNQSMVIHSTPFDIFHELVNDKQVKLSRDTTPALFVNNVVYVLINCINNMNSLPYTSEQLCEYLIESTPTLIDAQDINKEYNDDSKFASKDKHIIRQFNPNINCERFVNQVMRKYEFIFNYTSPLYDGPHEMQQLAALLITEVYNELFFECNISSMTDRTLKIINDKTACFAAQLNLDLPFISTLAHKLR